MTLFLSLRQQQRAGSVIDPQGFDDSGGAGWAGLRPVNDAAFAQACGGMDLLLATHGFNVDGDDGARHLATLAAQLGLGAGALFIGVLWPGDWWIPGINYPFEGDTSIDCGRRLAAYCRRWLGGAHSLSFLSHSLGARLVLEAVRNLDHVRSICLTAGAINNDCLGAEYATAAAKADRIAVLASRRDDVLKLAFPVGDPIADLLHDDHAAFRQALGRNGPAVPLVPHAGRPWQIPDPCNIGHGGYLPPQIPEIADFMANAFSGAPQRWPPN